MTPGTDQPQGQETDLELIGRWKAGDGRAATRLVARHADALSRFAASTGDRGDVEEIVQDTFVRAFGAIDSFRGESSFRTWLFTIARRLMLDRRRTEKRRRDTTEIKEGDAVTEYGALDAIIATEAAERVRVALEKLSPTQREVFLLRAQQGMAYKEIAEVVGSTEGSARVHYHNAVETIKRYLKDD
ncbi:MAG: RNA polymerase sigma factor [Gemmatimonadota bacterium]|nr:RNA polymerase sigma factor [Gemmatimonadota bacterium]